MIKNFILLGLIFPIFYILYSSSASAVGASLYLSPSMGTYTVGNTFPVQIKLNTGGTAINTSEGTLSFNTDKLEAISVSKAGSIFTLWVQEPAFSNTLGTITFAGGKPSPGFTGAAGIIITITFKARTASFATANVTFAGGSVLADDGKGTNILTSMNSGVYTLASRETTPVLPPGSEGEQPSEISENVLAAPVVFSSTHSDENQWYLDNNPEFNWELPLGVTQVSLLLHQKPDADPGFISDGLIGGKKYENIEDGIWYFHIKFGNQDGWGEITHRKVLIGANPLPFGAVQITKIPTSIRIGEILNIEGKAIPEITVRIYIQKLGQEPILEEVAPDSGGNFFLKYDKSLSQGEYQVFAQAEDKKGFLSDPTEKYDLEVVLPPFLKFGTIVLDYLTSMIILIILIVAAFAVIFYIWYRISIWKKRIRKETGEVSQSVAGTFKSLKAEIGKQVAMLDKKPGLSKGEKETRDKLHKTLDTAEKFIGKEIKDVKREIEE